jgi:hypothetical protein
VSERSCKPPPTSHKRRKKDGDWVFVRHHPVGSLLLVSPHRLCHPLSLLANSKGLVLSCSLAFVFYLSSF